jgi:alkanesulfonate monooxygenase SsuD/methylene tetrahydromethanopterin reductase-like flavin-dependent oxidoreductase (luciferase family)
MTDYGHELKFGVLLVPQPGKPLSVLDLADVTEEAGLDVVSLSDHPYWPDRLDTMALLAAIATRTTRVTVLPNLANLPLRPPAVLARTAATIDALSNGRFELGLGTGAQHLWDLIVAEGGPRRGAGESIDALEEAVRIIRALWTSDAAVTFDGRHYRLDGVSPGPVPEHDVGIWVGAYQPRLLRLVGAIADAWVPSSPYMPPERLAVANGLIDDAAAAAGRSPGDVRRAYNIAGQFTDRRHGFLQGPPGLWAQQLTECTLQHGMSCYLLYLANSADVIRRFAAEVVPATREMVAAARSGSTGLRAQPGRDTPASSE